MAQICVGVGKSRSPRNHVAFVLLAASSRAIFSAVVGGAGVLHLLPGHLAFRLFVCPMARRLSKLVPVVLVVVGVARASVVPVVASSWRARAARWPEVSTTSRLSSVVVAGLVLGLLELFLELQLPSRWCGCLSLAAVGVGGGPHEVFG